MIPEVYDLKWGGWSLGPNGAMMVGDALEVRQPSYVLEAGSGVSTIVFARYARQAEHPVRIVSLEHDAEFFERTSRLLVEQRLRKFVDLRLVPLTLYRTPFGSAQSPTGSAFWYETKDLPEDPIDFVLVDGPPGHITYGRVAALPALWERLATDFELWMDDVNRIREQRNLERWIKKYPVVVETRGAGPKLMARVTR